MARKKVTSSDVAEKAGVSQATVSMVLNHKYNVSFSRETVEKVESAARELGYQLPGHKNKKENKKEKMIVVFCPTITSPYYVMLLQGIEAVANERGYGVFICNTQRDARMLLIRTTQKWDDLWRGICWIWDIGMWPLLRRRLPEDSGSVPNEWMVLSVSLRRRGFPDM